MTPSPQTPHPIRRQALRPRLRGALRVGGSLLVLAVAAAGCSSAVAVSSAPVLVKPGTLTVCTALPYQPFEFKRKGAVVGFDIDLADAVATQLKLTPVVLNENFNKIQTGALLNDGTCDVAVAGMTITGDRARVLDFSSPYFNATQSLVVKGSASTTLPDLAGKRIGVQKGTTGELYLTDNLPAGATVVTYPNVAAVGMALAGGKISAGVYDSTVVGDVVNRNSGFVVSQEFNTGEQYGMAVKKNGNTNLLRTIDDVLATMKTDGAYDTLYQKWFSRTPTAS